MLRITLDRFSRYPGTWTCAMLAALSAASALMGDIRGGGSLGLVLALLFVVLAVGTFVSERSRGHGARDENSQ